MKNAILGTDLSLASTRIVENSQVFKLFGIERIVLVYVLNLRSFEDLSEYNLDSAQEKIENQKKQLVSMGFDAETKILMGVPAAELMRQVKIQDAGLVIIGSRGHTWSKPTLGETASEVLHHMKCPVLLTAFNNQPDEQVIDESKKGDLHHFEKYLRQFRQRVPKIELAHRNINQHVLLTTDFSDFSENAFQWLKGQLAPVPRLTLLHIQDLVRISRHLENKLEEFNQVDTARLERLKEEFNRVHPETDIRIVLDYGIPKELIPRYIKDNNVSLTVMGSQGRGYVGEFFLGSVSMRVARQSESNVLIIPYQRKI